MEFPLSNDKLEYQGASNTASGDVKLVSKELKAVSAPSHDASRLVEQIKLTSGSHEENAEAEQPVQRESSSAGALLWTPSCEVPEFFGQVLSFCPLWYLTVLVDAPNHNLLCCLCS